MSPTCGTHMWDLILSIIRRLYNERTIVSPTCGNILFVSYLPSITERFRSGRQSSEIDISRSSFIKSETPVM